MSIPRLLTLFELHRNKDHRSNRDPSLRFGISEKSYSFALRDPPLRSGFQKLFGYHTSHRSLLVRTMGDPALQLNASANDGRLDNGPITRYLAMG